MLGGWRKGQFDAGRLAEDCQFDAGRLAEGCQFDAGRLAEGSV